MLEYAVGAATVAIAWSEYLNKVLEYVGLHDTVRVVSLAVPGGWPCTGTRGHHQPAGRAHPRAADARC